MVCHRASETHQAEKYQLGDKKEITGQAVVKTVNPRVGLSQNRITESKQVACPSFAEAECGAVVPWSGC